MKDLFFHFLGHIFVVEMQFVEYQYCVNLSSVDYFVQGEKMPTFATV